MERKKLIEIENKHSIDNLLYLKGCNEQELKINGKKYYAVLAETLFNDNIYIAVMGKKDYEGTKPLCTVDVTDESLSVDYVLHEIKCKLNA